MSKKTKALHKNSSVLVCVTGQKDCDRLIKTGRCIANERDIELQVLCVQPTAAGYDADCEELEYLRQTAKDADAEMTVYFHDNPALMAVGFVKQVSAVHIITGMAEKPINGFVDVIHQMLPSVPISMVSKDGIVYNICPDSDDCVNTIAVVPNSVSDCIHK